VSLRAAAWTAWSVLGAVLLAGFAPAQAQGGGDAAGEGGGTPLTVLLFHPDDGVDPLGFDAGGADPFALRYAPLVADKGRFDFPFFVADGVLPIEAIPDPARPYASALDAYSQAVDARAAEEPAAVLLLASLVAGGQATVQVAVEPRADLAAEDLRLRVALVEDHVEYQPPPGLTNGVTDHRFTVRAYADLGRMAETGNASRTFLLGEEWARERLSVAAWLQQGAPSPRFDAREVVQATSAPLGDAVVQSGKGVLVEMLSATWCDPCLYGDEAVEALAVEAGVAEPGGAPPEWRYLEPTGRTALALAGAAALGAAIVALAWRTRRA
jgi:thiol-disulfide isomerase/thioredoxin